MGTRTEGRSDLAPADLAAAMQDPAREFVHPNDIVARHDWSVVDRYAVLRQWKYDLGQLNLATEENMPPTGPVSPVTIADIHAAMASLGMPLDADPVANKGA